MPAVSRIESLAPELRQIFEQICFDKNFANIREITAALNDAFEQWLERPLEEGEPFSVTTVWRAVSARKKLLQDVTKSALFAAELEKYLGPQSLGMAKGANAVVQMKMFQMLTEGEKLSAKDLSGIARALADISRSSIAIQKQIDTAREEDERELIAVGKCGSIDGVDITEEQAEAIARRLYRRKL